MIVWNDFRNDARVLKEAETLQSTGYQVVVHALHTPDVTDEYQVLDSGIKVARVVRNPLWRWRKRKQQSSPSDSKSKAGPIGKIGFATLVLRIVARLWTHAGLLWQMVKSKPDVIHAHDVNTFPSA